MLAIHQVVQGPKRNSNLLDRIKFQNFIPKLLFFINNLQDLETFASEILFFENL